MLINLDDDPQSICEPSKITLFFDDRHTKTKDGLIQRSGEIWRRWARKRRRSRDRGEIGQRKVSWQIGSSEGWRYSYRCSFVPLHNPLREDAYSLPLFD
jgi:hypothetical protein